MILTGTKSLTNTVTNIESRMSDKYGVAFLVGGKKCFNFRDTFFIISGLKWSQTRESIILAEYADSINDAKKGLFSEDGDAFYIDEMSENDIFNALIKEVEA